MNQSPQGSHKGEVYQIYMTRNQNRLETTQIPSSEHGINDSAPSQKIMSRNREYDSSTSEDDGLLPLNEPMIGYYFGQELASGKKSVEKSDSMKNITSKSPVSTSTSQLPINFLGACGKREVRGKQNPGKGSSKGSKDPTEERAPNSRYACPFRKHNPRKYNVHHFQSCALGAFGSIARLKEHMYRRHLARFQCTGCGLLFKTKEELDAHKKATIICNRRGGQIAEGITPSIEERLRKRTRLTGDRKDENRWRDIYQMLFPGERVPSPFYEPMQDAAVPIFDGSNISMEEFLRQEVPTIFTDRLRTEVSGIGLHDSGLLGDIIRPSESFVTRLGTMITEALDAAIQSFGQISSKTARQTNQMLTPTQSSSSGSLLTPMQESNGTNSTTLQSSMMLMYEVPNSPISWPQNDQDLSYLSSDWDYKADEIYQPRKKIRGEQQPSNQQSQSRNNQLLDHTYDQYSTLDISDSTPISLENDDGFQYLQLLNIQNWDLE